MDPVEKAKIRLREWIHHAEHHMEDYEKLVRELEGLGKRESAQEMRRVIELAAQQKTSLGRALEALEGPEAEGERV